MGVLVRGAVDGVDGAASKLQPPTVTKNCTTLRRSREKMRRWVSARLIAEQEAAHGCTTKGFGSEWQDEASSRSFHKVLTKRSTSTRADAWSLASRLSRQSESLPAQDACSSVSARREKRVARVALVFIRRGSVRTLPHGNKRRSQVLLPHVALGLLAQVGGVSHDCAVEPQRGVK